MAPAPTLHRIAKLLARAGVASRRDVERMIAEGRVALNGVVVDTPATLLASLAGVTVDGEQVEEAAPARLFLFHKPAGTLTAARDFGGRRTIYDVLPSGLPRVMPVGRLDLNTEGLLLLTTDGGLKRTLELPATGVERTYRARAYGHVSQPQLEALIDGVEVEGVRYGRIDANLERRTGANVWIELTLTEGKNREVRRVLEHLGLKVGRLIRTRYGPFVLGDLPVGAVGEVRDGDVATLRRLLEKGRALGTAEGVIAVPPMDGGVPPAARARRPRPIEVSTQDRPATERSAAPVAAAHRPMRDPATTPTLPTGATPKKRAVAGAGRPRSPAAPGEDAVPGQRPARPPQRKEGWARPKPKTSRGPKRPRK